MHNAQRRLETDLAARNAASDYEKEKKFDVWRFASDPIRRFVYTLSLGLSQARSLGASRRRPLFTSHAVHPRHRWVQDFAPCLRLKATAPGCVLHLEEETREAIPRPTAFFSLRTSHLSPHRPPVTDHGSLIPARLSRGSLGQPLTGAVSGRRPGHSVLLLWTDISLPGRQAVSPDGPPACLPFLPIQPKRGTGQREMKRRRHPPLLHSPPSKPPYPGAAIHVASA